MNLHRDMSPPESQPDQIRLGQFTLDLLNLDEIMERLNEFLQNDHLNTFAFLSRQTLLDAKENTRLADYIARLDASVPCETELLEAAGVTGGRVFEEVGSHKFFDRIFWQMVKAGLGLYLLGESEKECTHLEEYLLETFPGIRVVGRIWLEDGLHDSDHILNRINSENPDVILTGLTGQKQNLFMLRNQSKVLGKIWMNFGESPYLRETVGMKQSWLIRQRIKRYFCDIFVHNE